MRRQHQIKAGGPKAYWAAMRLLTQRAGHFAIPDVAERCDGAALNTVACYVHACARDGHLEVVGERPPAEPTGRPFKLFAVKVTAPEAAPFEKPGRAGQLGAVHQQLWTTMRGLPRFTTRELAATASTDDVSIGPNTARIFVWKLRQAGYIQTLGKDGRWPVMRIAPGKNTGPNPPAITGAGDVVDRNPRSQRRRSS